MKKISIAFLVCSYFPLLFSPNSRASELSSRIAAFSQKHPLSPSAKLDTFAIGARDFLVTPKGNILGIHETRLVFWRRNADATYAPAKGLSSWRAHEGTFIAKVPDQENEYRLYWDRGSAEQITLDEEKGSITINHGVKIDQVPGVAYPPGICFDYNKNEKKLNLFSLEGNLLRTFNNIEPMEVMQASFDHRHLLISQGMTLRAFDENGVVAKSFELSLNAGDKIYNVFPSPDGKYIMIGTHLGGLLVMDYETGSVVMHAKQKNPYLYVDRFSGDGGQLFTIGKGDEINIWNVNRLTADRVIASLPQQKIDAAIELINRFEAEEARLQREHSMLQLDIEKCWDALFSIIYN